MKTPIPSVTFATITDLLGTFYRLFPAPYAIPDSGDIDAIIMDWQMALAPLRDDAEARAAARLWCSLGTRFPLPSDLVTMAATLRAARSVLA